MVGSLDLWEKSLIVFLKLLFISKEPQNSVSVHGLFVYTCSIYIYKVVMSVWVFGCMSDQNSSAP